MTDELLLIRDGGEMPEVTFHSSLYYLTEDRDGPRLILTANEMGHLKKAVIQGYCAIIRRDLTPENREKGHYRGLKRCCVNWQRLLRFSNRERLDIRQEKEAIRALLKNFLCLEVFEVTMDNRPSSINCSDQEVNSLCGYLDLDPAELPEDWRKICLQPGS